jgi:hypothetical protein
MSTGFNSAYARTNGLINVDANDVYANDVYIDNLYVGGTKFNPMAHTTLIVQPTALVGTNVLQQTIFEDDVAYETTLNGITPTVFGYLSGVTSNIQSQFSNITDYPDGSVQASATYDRDINVKNDVWIGNETSTTDSVTGIITYSQTGENIKFKLNDITYTITKQQLMQLLNTLATESYVQTQVANLVRSSPVTLDTLQELATALGNDPNFATTITTLIRTKVNSSDLANYLTTSSASSTYQPISGMSSYLTTASASSTYQPISSMSNYPTLSGNNTLSGANSLTGYNTFTKPILMNNNTNFITCNTTAWTNLTGTNSSIYGNNSEIWLQEIVAYSWESIQVGDLQAHIIHLWI